MGVVSICFKDLFSKMSNTLDWVCYTWIVKLAITPVKKKKKKEESLPSRLTNHTVQRCFHCYSKLRLGCRQYFTEKLNTKHPFVSARSPNYKYKYIRWEKLSISGNGGGKDFWYARSVQLMAKKRWKIIQDVVLKRSLFHIKLWSFLGESPAAMD